MMTRDAALSLLTKPAVLVQCPMPIDIPLNSSQGKVYQWRVEEPVNGTTQVSGSADLRVNVGDFM